jgi:hypothetical protein
LVAVPNIAVTAGAGYVIVMATSSTTGSYGWEVSDDNPYAGGSAMYQSAGGSAMYQSAGGAWTTETTGDLDFFTTVI